MHLAHRARETVDLLRQETPDFIPPDLWHPNIPELNPVDYKIWVIVQSRVYQTKICSVHGWTAGDQRLVWLWTADYRHGYWPRVEDFERASIRKEHNSNTTTLQGSS